MKKLLFVYNPFSGKGAITGALSDVLCKFTEAGYEVTVHPTSAQGDGQDFITCHAEEYDLIVCAGGDGMLHELFGGIIASDCVKPCGYIPSGTINDFASSVKIPKNPAEAADIILAGCFEKIDAGCFNGDIFAYVAAFGIFTDVSYSTSQNLKNTFGVTAYLLEALRSLDLRHFNEATVHAKIKFNDTEIEDDFIFGLVGNTLSVGGRPNLIPPDAQMNDGLLDGVFIKAPRNIIELEKIQFALISQNLSSPFIFTEKASAFEIAADRDIRWTLDGEFGGNCDNAVITVKEKAVTIAVPEEGDK